MVISTDKYYFWATNQKTTNVYEVKSTIGVRYAMKVMAPHRREGATRVDRLSYCYCHNGKGDGKTMEATAIADCALCAVDRAWNTVNCRMVA